MLGKRCTFIVISPRDGQIREYGFFPRVLWLILLGGLGFVGVLGYYAYAQGLYQSGDQKALLALRDENKTLIHRLEQTHEEVQQLGEAMDQLKATEDRQPLTAGQIDAAVEGPAPSKWVNAPSKGRRPPSPPPVNW